MSADSWVQCPVCTKRAMRDRNALVKKMSVAYGNVSEEEYHHLRDKVAKPFKVEITLREDWEIGMSKDFMFYVDYKCRCKVCGFEFSYTYTKAVPEK